MLPQRYRRDGERLEVFDPINLSIQLIVEGGHDALFFESLLRNLRIDTQVQLQIAGGHEQIVKRLPTFAKSQLFVERVRSLGVICDGDDDPGAALRSIQESLRKADLPAPADFCTVVDKSPCRVGVAIMPGGPAKGSIETLLLRTVEKHPHMECVEQYVRCISGRERAAGYDECKAKVAVLLGGFFGCYKHVGTARGFWDVNHAVLGPIKSFIATLAAETGPASPGG